MLCSIWSPTQIISLPITGCRPAPRFAMKIGFAVVLCDLLRYKDA